MATAPTLRVQHNPQRDPAGIGVKSRRNRDGDGAIWLKAAVDEPIAKRLVAKGRSAGLQRRHRAARRSSATRPGRRAAGSSRAARLVEVIARGLGRRTALGFLSWSRPPTTAPPSTWARWSATRTRSPRRSAADVTKDGSADTWTETTADMSGFQMPADLDITFTPNDMARLMQAKVVEKHYAGLAAKARRGGRGEAGRQHGRAPQPRQRRQRASPTAATRSTTPGTCTTPRISRGPATATRKRPRSSSRGGRGNSAWPTRSMMTTARARGL